MPEQWVITQGDCRLAERPQQDAWWLNSEKQGQWRFFGATALIEQVTYHRNQAHGQATVYASDGTPQQQGQVRWGYSVGVWQLNGRWHDFGQGQSSPYLGLAQFHYRGFDCDADQLPDDADDVYLIGVAAR